MSRRIRQGQTRWLLEDQVGHGGLPDAVLVLTCIVVRVTWARVEYFDGRRRRSTSHWGWRQMQPTRRRAWAEAWRRVRATDRIRDNEFATAWQEQAEP